MSVPRKRGTSAARRNTPVTPTPQHGGRRNGAGRKPLDDDSTRVMLTLTSAQVAGLQAAFPALPIATAARHAVAAYLRDHTT